MDDGKLLWVGLTPHLDLASDERHLVAVFQLPSDDGHDVRRVDEEELLELAQLSAGDDLTLASGVGEAEDAVVGLMQLTFGNERRAGLAGDDRSLADRQHRIPVPYLHVSISDDGEVVEVSVQREVDALQLLRFQSLLVVGPLDGVVVLHGASSQLDGDLGHVMRRVTYDLIDAGHGTELGPVGPQDATVLLASASGPASRKQRHRGQRPNTIERPLYPLGQHVEQFGSIGFGHLHLLPDSIGDTSVGEQKPSLFVEELDAVDDLVVGEDAEDSLAFGVGVTRTPCVLVVREVVGEAVISDENHKSRVRKNLFF